MKVLVTGAEGFIGSHLTEKLLDSGHEVNALVQYNSFADKGWLKNIQATKENNLRIYFGDVRDENSMVEAFTGVEVVFHLAALIAIPYSYTSPKSYIDTNVLGTLNVLQLSRRFNISKLIHTSTSEVYGSSQMQFMSEKHPLVAQSPYAASKIAADQLVESFSRSFDLPAVTIRPFNTFGPRQSLRAVIPSILNQAIQSNQVFVGAVDTSRDFTFVQDTVSGFLLAAEAQGVLGETINLGTGYETSILEILRLTEVILNKKIEVIEDEARKRPITSEVTRLCSDNTKAKEKLNWVPSHIGPDGFSLGLHKTIEWLRIKENLNMFQNNGFTK